MTLYIGIDDATADEAFTQLNLGEDTRIVFRGGVHELETSMVINTRNAKISGENNAKIIMRNAGLIFGPNASNVRVEDLTFITVK